MQKNETFLTPNYMASFKCVGKDCIDTCCTGLHIEIDKETYKSYINSSDKKINSISKQYISKNYTDTTLSYAKIEKKNQSCPFLADNKSCNAYNILGQENLSVACSTYPRVVKKLDNLNFIAGELSCPEMSKLCLSTTNIKINEFKKNELNNIFNSNKIHTIDIPQNLPDRIRDFFEMVFIKLSNKDTFFKNLEEIILYYYNINNKYNSFSTSNTFLYEKEKLKKDNLLLQLKFLPKMFFKENLDKHSRFLRIRIKAADKSKYFEITETDFQKKYIYNYNSKFINFINNNNFIYKNLFLNEFIRNIDCFLLSEDYFDLFIRRFLFKINISNFLIICLSFEKNKKITINDYVKVISALSKTFQNAKEKNMLMINFFKKLDKNNLFLRLLDIY